MANKVRVHELAKEIGVSSGDLIKELIQDGVDATSHLSIVDPDTVELVRDHFNSKDPKKSKAEKIATAQQNKVLDAASNNGKEAKVPTSIPANSSSPDSEKQKKKEDEEKELISSQKDDQTDGDNEIHLKPPIVVKQLAVALKIKPNELIHSLLKMNVFATINQTLDIRIADKICKKYGFNLVADKREKHVIGLESQEDEISPEEIIYDDEKTLERAPVVAFMGHVDHGKTSLQDKIRQTKVAAGEAGGITQHIGASSIEWKKKLITFIDTPGHEAFTAMRARGADTTDIVILVVAADDGVMPQTIEAMNHAKAANVPIIVAVNKMDLPGADPLKVMTQFQQQNLALEEWGGEVGVVKVSALTGDGIDDLLERILLEAELLELKANPKLPVKSIVLESQLEQGLGPTVNILIKNGSIKQGDIVLSGQFYGKVKALFDHLGKRVKSAGPSEASKVVGLSGLPEGGTLLVGCADDKLAKRLSESRSHTVRERDLQPDQHANLEDLFRQMNEESRKELKIIIKTDAQGTGEAVMDILNNLESPKIKIEVIHAGVGAISDSDVLLAAASDAIIVGFHVKVNSGVNTLADNKGVQIRLYSVIYELAEQMKESMEGMLDPEIREEALGKSEILKIFAPSKGPKICGCNVTKGEVKVGAKARVYRGNELIYNGVIQSLRRFQDNVKLVKQGFECGIRLDHFNEFEVGDMIDIYEFKEYAAKL